MMEKLLIWCNLDKDEAKLSILVFLILQVLQQKFLDQLQIVMLMGYDNSDVSEKV